MRREAFLQSLLLMGAAPHVSALSRVFPESHDNEYELIGSRIRFGQSPHWWVVEGLCFFILEQDWVSLSINRLVGRAAWLPEYRRACERPGDIQVVTSSGPLLLLPNARFGVRYQTWHQPANETDAVLIVEDVEFYVTKLFAPVKRSRRLAKA